MTATMTIWQGIDFSRIHPHVLRLSVSTNWLRLQLLMHVWLLRFNHINLNCNFYHESFASIQLQVIMAFNLNVLQLRLSLPGTIHILLFFTSVSLPLGNLYQLISTSPQELDLGGYVYLKFGIHLVVRRQQKSFVTTKETTPDNVVQPQETSCHNNVVYFSWSIMDGNEPNTDAKLFKILVNLKFHQPLFMLGESLFINTVTK